MRLSLDPRLPATGDVITLKARLYEVFREIATQVNLSSEGAIQGAYNARTSAPSTGSHQQGDFVRNSATVEAGTAGSKYAVLGWVCVASGSPGTWKECRVLTGG